MQTVRLDEDTLNNGIAQPMMRKNSSLVGGSTKIASGKLKVDVQKPSLRYINHIEEEEKEST